MVRSRQKQQMTLNITKHRDILLQILKDIYSDTTISPFLGFKGGTAALLFYGLNRFSVDLDFDLLDESKEDFIFEKVRDIIKNYGEIKEARKKRFNLIFTISYEKGTQAIKIEINRRSFGSEYQLKTYLGISMLVMREEDMFAHKLVAMRERIGKTNRDIYDVWVFLKNNWPINKKIVEKRTGISLAGVLKDCLIKLEKLNNSKILSGVGELLTQSQEDWAKAKLKEDTIFLLRLRLKTNIN